MRTSLCSCHLLNMFSRLLISRIKLLLMRRRIIHTCIHYPQLWTTHKQKYDIKTLIYCILLLTISFLWVVTLFVYRCFLLDNKWIAIGRLYYYHFVIIRLKSYYISTFSFWIVCNQLYCFGLECSINWLLLSQRWMWHCKASRFNTKKLQLFICERHLPSFLISKAWLPLFYSYQKI